MKNKKISADYYSQISHSLFFVSYSLFFSHYSVLKSHYFSSMNILCTPSKTAVFIVLYFNIGFSKFIFL